MPNPKRPAYPFEFRAEADLENPAQVCGERQVDVCETTVARVKGLRRLGSAGRSLIGSGRVKRCATDP